MEREIPNREESIQKDSISPLYEHDVVSQFTGFEFKQLTQKFIQKNKNIRIERKS